MEQYVMDVPIQQPLKCGGAKPSPQLDGTSHSHIQVRLVLGERHDSYRYESISVDIKNQGESLMSQLRDLRRIPSLRLRILATISDAVNMRQDAIWLVSASLYSTTIFIKDAECISYLTPVINDPISLRSAKSFVVDHLSSVIVRGDSNVGPPTRNAICFGKALNRTAAFIWFGTAMVITIILGSIIVSTMHDLSIGLAVGSFLSAIFGVIQYLILYQQTFSPI